GSNFNARFWLKPRSASLLIRPINGTAMKLVSNIISLPLASADGIIASKLAALAKISAQMPPPPLHLHLKHCLWTYLTALPQRPNKHLQYLRAKSLHSAMFFWH